MRKIIWILILILAKASTSWAQVQEVDVVDTQLYHEVMISKEKNISFSTSQLKSQHVERNNFLHISGQTFLENLTFIPGLQMVVTGTNVMKPVLRGMTLSRVWVGEHFVKQEGQQWGMDHGLELDPFIEGNINIIKGPSNIIHGAEALGGAININHKKNTDIDTQFLSVMSMYKSVNDLYGIFAQFNKVYNNRAFTLQASYQTYADYKVPADTFIYNRFKLPIYDKRLVNTGGRDINALASLTTHFKDWTLYTQASVFSQEAGLFKGAFGKPQSMDLSHDKSYRNIEEPLQKTTHLKYFLDLERDWEHLFLDNVLSIQYNNRQELSAHRHLLQTDNLALNLKLLTIQNNFSLKKLWNPQHISQLIYYGGYQHNDINGYEFLIPQYTKWLNALALNHTFYSTTQHKFNLGVRLDHIYYQTQSAYRWINDNGYIHQVEAHTAMNKDYFNFNLQFNWDYKINKHNIFQLNLSRIDRTPNIAELASNGIHHGTFRHELGDAQLNTEKGWTIDLGWVYNQSKWDMHFTPFIYYFENYIYLKPTAYFSTLPEAGQLYQYSQSQALLTGAELQWMWTYIGRLKGELTLEYVYAQNMSSQRALPMTPPLSIRKNFNYTTQSERSLLDDIELHYDIEYYAAQDRVDVNERKSPDYWLHHISLEKPFAVGSSQFKLDVQVKNIFNEKYFNHMSRYRIINIPEAGRNIALSLKYII